MGLLSKLKADLPTDVKGEEDRVGGGAQVKDSGAYPITIKLAYLTVASSGANGLVIHGEFEDGSEYRSTEWLTSGTAKGCKTYFEYQGEKRYLQGYLNADAICQVITGKGILEQHEEERVAKLWNRDAKAEVPTPVNAIPDLIGKTFVAGLIKKSENKQVKDNNGNYVKTAETREINELNKVFSADGLTVTELAAGQKEPAFFNSWVDRFQGVVVDKVDKTAAPAPAQAGGAAPATGATSLFGRR